MVIGNVYEPSNTLLFDHIYRRESTSEAIEGYYEKVLECHKDFTNSIAESMKAEVEIIWGQKVQRRLIQTEDIAVLPLWGDFKDVVIMLGYERNYCNADPRFRFRRVFLLACHPQHMFYQRKNSRVAIRQDKVMLAAARMVRNCVPWVQSYYSEKKWYSCVSSLLKIREIKLLAQILETKQQMPLLTIQSVDENTTSQLLSTGIWDVFFSDRPHSNDKLRELIPPALDALKMCKSSASWQLPSDLPDPVLEWFQGQKQIFISNVSLSNFSDVVHALRQILPESEPNSAELLLDIFKKILIYQQETVKNVTGKHQELWHSTFDGRAIDVFCKTCKVPQMPDSSLDGQYLGLAIMLFVNGVVTARAAMGKTDLQFQSIRTSCIQYVTQRHFISLDCRRHILTLGSTYESKAVTSRITHLQLSVGVSGAKD